LVDGFLNTLHDCDLVQSTPIFLTTIGPILHSVPISHSVTGMIT
jgi:hypothetical protein